MFEDAHGRRGRMIASAVALNFRRRSLLDSARVALQAIFVGVTVALFFAWLAYSSSHRSAIPGFDSATNCKVFGRGGVVCSDHSAIHD